MPYFITDKSPECPAWAVVKADGELLGCHDSKESAIDQMVAVSINEQLDPGGEYEGTFPDDVQDVTRAMPEELSIGDFVSWDSSGGKARGQIELIITKGEIDVPDSSFTITGTEEDPAALIRIWRQEEDDDSGLLEWEETDTLVGHKFSTLAKIDSLRRIPLPELREVNLDPPAYMRAAARKGLEYYEEGLGGDGLVERTIREARAMASGSVTADKWVRIRAWIARHLGDLDAPAADPDSPEYPSAGVVAHLLWGSGPSKRAAERALAYAEGVVARLEEENSGRARGKNLAAIEHRTNPVDYELRETAEGMTFEGYAAIFDSPSHPLPFEEKIAPGAFLRSLKSRNDIKLLWNHDTGSVLGSTRAGTLRLVEDERGLKVRAELPNTSAGRDAAELLRRGDVDAMSFGFTVPKGGEEWSADGRQRTLREVMLHEVSIVAFPAYAETAGTATVRALDKIAARANVDVDALADALLKLETGEDFTVDDRNLLNRVIEEITPGVDASEEDKGDYAMLSLKKKKLELLGGY